MGHRHRRVPTDERMRRVTLAVVVDVALIILFAALGRRTHDEGSAVGGTLTVAAPFIIGYLIAAAALRLWPGPVLGALRRPGVGRGHRAGDGAPGHRVRPGTRAGVRRGRVRHDWGAHPGMASRGRSVRRRIGRRAGLSAAPGAAPADGATHGTVSGEGGI